MRYAKGVRSYLIEPGTDAFGSRVETLPTDSIQTGIDLRGIDSKFCLDLSCESPIPIIGGEFNQAIVQLPADFHTPTHYLRGFNAAPQRAADRSQLLPTPTDIEGQPPANSFNLFSAIFGLGGILSALESALPVPFRFSVAYQEDPRKLSHLVLPSHKYLEVNPPFCLEAVFEGMTNGLDF